MSINLSADGKPITIYQHIESGDSVITSKSILRHSLLLKDSLESLYQTQLSGSIFVEPSGIYLHFQGLNSLYRWENEGFINMYGRNFHGFNFESFSFIRDSTIYNYGGSGFWQNNGSLIYFDSKLGEWQFLYSTREILDLHHNAARVHFYYKEALYIVFSESLDAHRNSIKTDYSLAKLNLSDYNTEVFNIDNNAVQAAIQNISFRGFNSLDYFLVLDYIAHSIKVIHKSSLEYAEVPKKYTTDLNFSLDSKWLVDNLAFVYINKNEFGFIDKKMNFLGTIDLDKISNDEMEWNSLVSESFLLYKSLALFGLFSVGFWVIWK